MMFPATSPHVFQQVVKRLEEMGYGSDIAWAENLGPPTDAGDFAEELIFVICNSGMRFTVARGIYDRVMVVLRAGGSSSTTFGHAGKCGAIDAIWAGRKRLLAEYLAATDQLEWLGTLPWIGPITKFHAAKNFGIDCVKPDVHMTRLAGVMQTTPDAMCRELARATGLRVATVDTVLWRACATGVINSRTGEAFPAP